MAVSYPSLTDSALAALAAGKNRDPFGVLGPHPDERGRGTVIRAFLPAAQSVDLVQRPAGDVPPMSPRDPEEGGPVRILLRDPAAFGGDRPRHLELPLAGRGLDGDAAGAARLVRAA